MTGHRSWADAMRDKLARDPEARALYEQARAELMAAWDALCRHGCCLWWVSQDSNRREDLGGIGPAACPCACNGGDWLWWVRRNEDKPHRCPGCHAVATWEHKRIGPRTRLTCPNGCGLQWRYGRRQQVRSMRYRRWLANLTEVPRPS